MTLYRQLLGMILAFFVLLLGLVYSLEFTHTRDYLAKQQESDVQNTLTTLGMSLLPHLESKDAVSVESVVNVVFDGGYYQEISVEMAGEDPANPKHVRRTLSTEIVDIPRWFTDLALFDPVQESNVLTSGWMQLGTLTVKGHPGYAYQQLWSLMSQMLLWFVFAFIVCGVLVVYGLRYLLAPLHHIEERAREIAHQHFGKPLPEPKLPELSGLVRAFNAMSGRLKMTFEQQAEEAETLRREAFQDRVTGFGNRSFFNGQLQQWLSEPGSGGVLLMEVQGIEEVYREEGFQGRNQYMQATADLLRQLTQEVSGAVLARISLHEFAALLPGLDAEQLEKLVQRLFQASAQAVVNPFEEVASCCRLGASLRRDGSTITELLSYADLALQQAKRDAQHGYRVHMPDREQVVLGREGWKQLAVQAMQHGWLYLQSQAVTALQDASCLHRELFSGIERDGVRYPAGQFMPFVEQYGLGGQFDRQVLELLAAQKHTFLPGPLAVNLAMNALADPGFTSWLGDFLREHADLAKNLVFEVPEESVKLHYPELEALCHQFHALGVGYGIDRFGHSFERLGQLAALRPAYLKVDISYLLDEDGRENPGFITALAKLAHAQDAQIIVTRVESEEQLGRLRNLPVDAYQGYIQPPEDLLV